jgi:hypothetical protein
VKIICRYYSVDENLILLQNLEENETNLDIRAARKILVQIFFNLLKYHTRGWVKNNTSQLLQIANCNEDSLKEVYAVAKIYPNQLNDLKSSTELKRDIDVKEEFKYLYNKVTKDEIRSQLAYKEFNHFIAEDRFITNKYLTTLIEDILFETDITNVNHHPFKPEILNIISKLKLKHYAELFPRLDDKKANLMLEIVTNERIKNDIFAIVTLKEEQLKKLGQLVQSANFEVILNKAAIDLEQENERQADFQHKYEIGRNIERLVREKLADEIQERISFENKSTIRTEDEQGGQDIVVTLDKKERIYFIEVKSRWNAANSISMSKLQLQRAAEQSQRYALCSVDITRYIGIGNRYKLSIDEIIPLTKFVENIGDEIKPLIAGNLNAEKNINQAVHLVDYRGVVPQDIIQTGHDFHDFVERLLSAINSVILEHDKSN